MARLRKEELEELQDADTWEEVGVIAQPAKQAPRAIVPVAFPREDFERITAQAKQAGMTASEFIRQAAIRQSARSQPRRRRDPAPAGLVGAP